eukprot:1726030-Rhodomonas_salina.1
MSPRKIHASSTLSNHIHQWGVSKPSRIERVGVYPHDAKVPYHVVAKYKRSRRKADSSHSAAPQTPYFERERNVENEELQRLIPLKLNLHVDSCYSPAERPAYYCGPLFFKFNWVDAFSTFGDTMLVVFDRLPLPALANVQRVCKGFHRMIRNSPLLSHKLATPGAANFLELYKLDELMAIAPVPTADSPCKKPLQGSYRKILVDWLVDVQGEYNLSSETLHQAIILVDRCFAAKPEIATNKIQLLGATCLFIASKFSEVEGPTLMDMVWVCDNCYQKEDHMQMEILVLSILDFRLRCVTPAEIITSFCQAFEHAKETEQLAMYYADLFMLEGASIGARPLLTAAAAFTLSLHTQAFPIPADQISFICKSSTETINKLACQMQALHLIDFNGLQNSGLTPADTRQPLRACKERYSSPKGMHIFARYPPRDPTVLVSEPGNLQGNNVRCGWCKGSAC